MHNISRNRSDRYFQKHKSGLTDRYYCFFIHDTRHYFLILSLFLLSVGCHPQSEKTTANPGEQDLVITSFQNLNADPETVHFQNNLPVNNEGGHIQGIQAYTYQGTQYIFMSGSSSTEAYYAVVKTGETHEVVSVNPILQKPLKHAGGFQIHQNLMAIGIEDNEARDVSKVYIYELNDPLHPPEKPVKMIERSGPYERATAGCVAITTYQGQILVMVGDWSTRHLDIYACAQQGWKNDEAQFELLASVSTATLPKDDWVTPSWLAYQNINLIHHEGNLYLVGLGANKVEEDVADLFRVEEKGMKTWHFEKVATKKFERENGTNFRWGAGVVWHHAQGFTSILSSTGHLETHSLFNQYDNQ